MSQRFKTVAIYITATLLAILFGAFILGNLDRSNSKPEPDPLTVEPVYTPATADEIYTLVNKERGKAGLQPLIRTNELDVSAQFKADDMANRDYFSHDDPATGKKNGLDKALELVGQSCTYVGENLHSGGERYSTAEEAVKGWMGSKAHHDAIVDPEQVYTGIGIAIMPNGDSVQVQHFCKTK